MSTIPGEREYPAQTCMREKHVPRRTAPRVLLRGNSKRPSGERSMVQCEMIVPRRIYTHSDLTRAYRISLKRHGDSRLAGTSGVTICELGCQQAVLLENIRTIINGIVARTR